MGAATVAPGTGLELPYNLKARITIASACPWRIGILGGYWQLKESVAMLLPIVPAE